MFPLSKARDFDASANQFFVDTDIGCREGPINKESSNDHSKCIGCL